MRFSKFFIAIIAFFVAFAACKKNDNGTVNLEPNFYFINGNIADSDRTLILFSASDTVTYNVVISSTYFLSSNALVRIAASDSYRDSYNTTVGSSFAAMPVGAYSFKDTITFTPYSTYDTISVSIYKHALSPDKQYMLPLQIVSADGHNIDAGASVIYLHTSNNTYSGIYNSTGIRVMYNGDAADSNVNMSNTFSLVKNSIPVTPNTSEIDYADLGSNGWKYSFGFSTEDSTFFVAPNLVIINSVEHNSFKVLTATFDSTTHDVYIKTSYKNTSGDERIVEESLTLQ